ncbi:hypothetical protein VTP01DRAFT_7099 [Rhizomucor pusillus]|uniref:uncharacterized protein n=1 Tax=Rhizomucor pusillus TaxID=4840 RepID=UPI003744A9F5
MLAAPSTINAPSDSKTAYTKKDYTLVFMLDEQNRKILLGMKKRGFGVNLYNGFGGKVEPGESVYQAAVRELEEEATIRAKLLRKLAINVFTFENDPLAVVVHIFFATEFEGKPAETEEMRPEWFDYDSIPHEQMWPDARVWFQHMLKKQPFLGEYHFSEDQRSTLAENFQLLSEPPEEYDITKSTVLKQQRITQ